MSNIHPTCLFHPLSRYGEISTHKFMTGSQGLLCMDHNALKSPGFPCSTIRTPMNITMMITRSCTKKKRTPTPHRVDEPWNQDRKSGNCDTNIFFWQACCQIVKNWGNFTIVWIERNGSIVLEFQFVEQNFQLRLLWHHRRNLCGDHKNAAQHLAQSHNSWKAPPLQHGFPIMVLCLRHTFLPCLRVYRQRLSHRLPSWQFTLYDLEMQSGCISRCGRLAQLSSQLQHAALHPQGHK